MTIAKYCSSGIKRPYVMLCHVGRCIGGCSFVQKKKKGGCSLGSSIEAMSCAQIKVEPNHSTLDSQEVKHFPYIIQY